MSTFKISGKVTLKNGLVNINRSLLSTFTQQANPPLSDEQTLTITTSAATLVFGQLSTIKQIMIENGGSEILLVGYDDSGFVEDFRVEAGMLGLFTPTPGKVYQVQAAANSTGIKVTAVEA